MSHRLSRAPRRYFQILKLVLWRDGCTLVVGAVLVLIGRCNQCLAFRLVMNSCLIWWRRESYLASFGDSDIADCVTAVNWHFNDTTNLADRVTGRQCCDGRVFRVLVCASVAMNLINIPSPSGHYMYRTAVTICTASLTFTILRSAHTAVFMCFVWISEQTAIISLYSIDWLVFITVFTSRYGLGLQM